MCHTLKCVISAKCSLHDVFAEFSLFERLVPNKSGRSFCTTGAAVELSDADKMMSLSGNMESRPHHS